MNPRTTRWNPYTWCCRADTPPSGTRHRRSDKRLSARFIRRQLGRELRTALREDA